MNLKGKRLLVLGGSRISCEIIRHARAMGIITGVTDWYELDRSPAKQIADEAYFVSTSDIDAMTDLIKSRHFDGVITGFTDSVLPYYAEMCDKAGLPAYGTKEQFEIFINKQKYKDLFNSYNIRTIPQYNININNYDESVRNIKFPVITKPADGSGSKGVSICGDKEELRKAVEFARENSKTREILVEQYIEAPEATVFWLFVNGSYYVMLLGNRHVKHNQYGELPLPVGYTFPSAILPSFLEEDAPNIEKMLHDMDVKNGMMFMQCKVVNGKCLTYDVGYRLTGTLEYKILKEICGFDPLDMLISFALTGDMGIPDINERIDPFLGEKYAYNISVLCKPGKISRITGTDAVKDLPGVIDVVEAHPVGDTITESMKGRLSQISIRVLGHADSIDEMKKEMLEIQKQLHVYSEDEEEMTLSGMDEDDFTEIIYGY